MAAMAALWRFCNVSISKNVQGPKLIKCTKFQAFLKVNGSLQIYFLSSQLQPQIQDMKGQAADAHGILSQLALKSLKQWKFVFWY